MIKQVIECDCCGLIVNYHGGCFMCPRCGLRDCSPELKEIDLSKVSCSA